MNEMHFKLTLLMLYCKRLTEDTQSTYITLLFVIIILKQFLLLCEFNASSGKRCTPFNLANLLASPC